DAKTLRVGDAMISVAEIVAREIAFLPLNPSGMWVELADDVRDAIGIQHALSCDIAWSTAGQIHNPGHLPAADYVRQNAMAVAHQKLTRSNRQFEGSIRSEVVPPIAGLQRVIRCAVSRIRIASRSSEQLAPCVRCLKVNANHGAQCCLGLQR